MIVFLSLNLVLRGCGGYFSTPMEVDLIVLRRGWGNFFWSKGSFSLEEFSERSETMG